MLKWFVCFISDIYTLLLCLSIKILNSLFISCWWNGHGQTHNNTKLYFKLTKNCIYNIILITVFSSSSSSSLFTTETYVVVGQCFLVLQILWMTLIFHVNCHQNIWHVEGKTVSTMKASTTDIACIGTLCHEQYELQWNWMYKTTSMNEMQHLSTHSSSVYFFYSYYDSNQIITIT